MKRTILKKYNYLIAFILSVLGVGYACSSSGCMYGSPAEDYGVPTATFKVHGTVTSSDDVKISNIRVVMQSDTDYTDVNGVYEVETYDFAGNQHFLLKFEDIDGGANGQYQSKDSLFDFIDPHFINGDGHWYEGETSEEVNIKLKE